MGRATRRRGRAAIPTPIRCSAAKATKVPGAFSGVLELNSSDKVEFECDITNNTNSIFVGANEAKDDEMCILVGDTVGATITPLCQYTTERL